MFGPELDIPAGPVPLPAEGGGAQPHFGIIPDLAVIVDDGAGPAEVGDPMDWIVELSRVGRIHQQPHFVAHRLGTGPAIPDFVDRTRGCPALREKRGGSGPVSGLNVELNLGSGDLARQYPKITSGAISTHGGALPGTLIQTVKKGGLREAVRIGDG